MTKFMSQYSGDDIFRKSLCSRADYNKPDKRGNPYRHCIKTEPENKITDFFPPELGERAVYQFPGNPCTFFFHRHKKYCFKTIRLQD